MVELNVRSWACQTGQKLTARDKCQHLQRVLSVLPLLNQPLSKVKGGARWPVVMPHWKACSIAALCRHGVICALPLFERPNVTMGAQYCEPMESKLRVTVWRTHSMRKFHSNMCSIICTHKGCNSKNVPESLNLWPHLGDGVSSTRPESQIVQGVARDWETQWHLCCYTL